MLIIKLILKKWDRFSDILSQTKHADFVLIRINMCHSSSLDNDSKHLLWSNMIICTSSSGVNFRKLYIIVVYTLHFTIFPVSVVVTGRNEKPSGYGVGKHSPIGYCERKYHKPGVLYMEYLMFLPSSTLMGKRRNLHVYSTLPCIMTCPLKRLTNFKVLYVLSVRRVRHSGKRYMMYWPLNYQHKKTK